MSPQENRREGRVLAGSDGIVNGLDGSVSTGLPKLIEQHHEDQVGVRASWHIARLEGARVSWTHSPDYLSGATCTRN